MAITRQQADRIAADALGGKPGGIARLMQAMDAAMQADNARWLAAHPEVAARKARVATMDDAQRRAEIARLDGTMAREGRVLTADELALRQELAGGR